MLRLWIFLFLLDFVIPVVDLVVSAINFAIFTVDFGVPAANLAIPAANSAAAAASLFRSLQALDEEIAPASVIDLNVVRLEAISSFSDTWTSDLSSPV